MITFTVATAYSQPIQIQGKRYRIDKRGSLIIIGPHFTTAATFPAGYWQSVTQHAQQ
ncbi:MAG: hypothetical protein LKJ47_04875 [Bifidobacteriaceae bacterium]|jgi:hypothetical protein|nr:hypothetical protein [Bifidobacteriaceae bacterium]